MLRKFVLLRCHRVKVYTGNCAVPGGVYFQSFCVGDWLATKWGHDIWLRGLTYSMSSMSSLKPTVLVWYKNFNAGAGQPVIMIAGTNCCSAHAY
jgi:hypothetical protein